MIEYLGQVVGASDSISIGSKKGHDDIEIEDCNTDKVVKKLGNSFRGKRF